MEYKYGMRLRGFSIGCQPMDGFVRREDDLTGVYHDIIVYDRPLNEKECEQYELDDLNPQETKVMIEDFLIEFDEMGFAPITLCPDPEKYAIEWREKVRAEFERLETENAALRARLEKAVELPFVSTDYHIEFWLAEIKQSVIDESAKIVIPVYVYLKCKTKNEAEARLAELKGGKE